MNPDPYTGLWGGENCRDSLVQTPRHCDCTHGKCSAEDNYIKQLETEFKYSLPRGKCAAMFAESIQGVGGSVQFPRNYIKRAAELVRHNGGLFVSDEVQTGFGRTGDHYWGFEGHGIIPDIVTMAKGIGNGFPLGAVVTTPKIAQVLTEAIHFNTFGGNPLACTVGNAVLDVSFKHHSLIIPQVIHFIPNDMIMHNENLLLMIITIFPVKFIIQVIDEEKLQENSLKVGTHLLKGFEALRDKYDVVGDVRGKVRKFNYFDKFSLKENQ